MNSATITPQQIEAYTTGEVELSELLQLEPHYIEQLRGRAQFFIDGDHIERALMMLDMLEELDRTEPLPTLVAIELLLRHGRSDAAELRIEGLLQHCPNSAAARVARAELLVQTGQLVAAAAMLEQVFGEDPEAHTEPGRRAQALAARAFEMFEAG